MPHIDEKNCDSWAEYEYPGESPTAALCNGGWWEGKRWETCVHRERCRRETKESQAAKRRVTLPTIAGPRPRTIASTPNLSSSILARRGGSVPTAPATNTVPTVVAPTQIHEMDRRNPYLSTERAPHQMGPSPTFIPKKKEGVFKRLGKNIAQGWVASLGWHLFDMAQQVDMFPEDDEDPPHGSE